MATKKGKPAPKKAAPKKQPAKPPAAKKSSKKKPAKEVPASGDPEALLQSALVQDHLPEAYKGLNLEELGNAIVEEFQNMPTPGATLMASMGQISPAKAFDICATYNKSIPYLLIANALFTAFKVKQGIEIVNQLMGVLKSICVPVTAAIAGGSPTGTEAEDVGTASEPGTPT